MVLNGLMDLFWHLIVIKHDHNNGFTPQGHYNYYDWLWWNKKIILFLNLPTDIVKYLIISNFLIKVRINIVLKSLPTSRFQQHINLYYLGINCIGKHTIAFLPQYLWDVSIFIFLFEFVYSLILRANTLGVLYLSDDKNCLCK